MYLRAVRTYKSVVMHSCISDHSELTSQWLGGDQRRLSFRPGGARQGRARLSCCTPPLGGSVASTMNSRGSGPTCEVLAHLWGRLTAPVINTLGSHYTQFHLVISASGCCGEVLWTPPGRASIRGPHKEITRTVVRASTAKSIGTPAALLGDNIYSLFFLLDISNGRV